MNTPKNIELFNILSAQVLRKLYRSFPVPVDLTDSMLAALVKKLDAEVAKLDGDLTPTRFAAGVLTFLQSQGYLNAGRKFSQCVLTTKGLAALNIRLGSLKGTPTTGERLLSLGEQISGPSATQVMKHLLDPRLWLTAG